MNTIDIGGELKDLPHPKYKDFFAKFNEIDSLSIKDWKPVHLIGYFCKLYRQYYNLDYKFKFNSSSPSKCYEVFQIKKLSQHLTSDPVKLKRYIDWAFQEKVKVSKKRITSIAFLAHEYMTTEYKLKYLSGDLRDQKIDRTTQIPDEYLQIINQYGHKINNYGELSFLLQIPSDDIKKLSQQLESSGLDLNILKGIA